MNFNTIYTELIAGQAKLALVGLGYVGMPIAVAFAAKGLKTIGYDNNKGKIEQYFRLFDVNLKAMAEEESWEKSELYDYLSSTQMLLIVFRETDDGYVFIGSQLWHVPFSDLDIIGEGWTAVRDRLKEGVTFTPIVDAKGNVVETYNYTP